MAALVADSLAGKASAAGGLVARPAVGPTVTWMPSVPCSTSPLVPRKCQASVA